MSNGDYLSVICVRIPGRFICLRIALFAQKANKRQLIILVRDKTDRMQPVLQTAVLKPSSNKKALLHIYEMFTTFVSCS